MLYRLYVVKRINIIMLKEIMENKNNKDKIKIIMINIKGIYVADRKGRKNEEKMGKIKNDNIK